MLMPGRRSDTPDHALWFMRHGATQPNLDGLRCGGDHDAPLTAIGRDQVLVSAQHMSALDLRLELVICSRLSRTVDSAGIVARVLGGLPVEIDDGFRERMLGDWNLQPVEATEAPLRSGVTPPGGESAGVFSARVLTAVTLLMQRHRGRRVMLLGSRGVARVLGENLPVHERRERNGNAARNGEVIAFDLSAWHAGAPAVSIPAAQTASRGPSSAHTLTP